MQFPWGFSIELHHLKAMIQLTLILILILLPSMSTKIPGLTHIFFLPVDTFFSFYYNKVVFFENILFLFFFPCLNPHFNLKMRVHAGMKTMWVNADICGLKLDSRIFKVSCLMHFQWCNSEYPITPGPWSWSLIGGIEECQFRDRKVIHFASFHP